MAEILTEVGGWIVANWSMLATGVATIVAGVAFYEQILSIRSHHRSNTDAVKSEINRIEATSDSSRASRIIQPTEEEIEKYGQRINHIETNYRRAIRRRIISISAVYLAAITVIYNIDYFLVASSEPVIARNPLEDEAVRRAAGGMLAHLHFEISDKAENTQKMQSARIAYNNTADKLQVIDHKIEDLSSKVHSAARRGPLTQETVEAGKKLRRLKAQRRQLVQQRDLALKAIYDSGVQQEKIEVQLGMLQHNTQELGSHRLNLSPDWH